MLKEIIIHSHFYQPPRENPNTLKIDNESSAYPYHNWNERITAECYRANSASRYLDEKGRIRKIINNYEYMSFNIGPTLLSYLKKEFPDVALKIKEADKKSVECLGEGNAIAQGYNHTILPLDDEDFARSQVRSALYDFEKFYGRKAKGFWCPECAISKSVIDILFEEGIEFTILSPLQIQHLKIGKEIINSMDIQPKHLCSPYWIKGKKHKIAAFFYNKELSTDISFNHLLHNADTLYDHIKEISDNNAKLIVAATDGEIYGHHEGYGDMAFAALTEKVKERKEFKFTNFATYLKHNKPKHEAVLIKGEDNKGSSWSCSHGVSRWYKDCGCHTGGGENWNQKWRTPLRKSLNIAKANVINEITKILKENNLDPKDTLLNFVEVLDNKRDLPSDVVNAINAYKWMSYSFTSCGWFFSDISGIETLHNIGYMLKSLTMLGLDKAKEEFIISLKKAKSNVKQMNNGEVIARRILEVYFTDEKLDDVLKAIEKDGINDENTEHLINILFIKGASPNSKEFFNAQNLIYREVYIKNKRNIKDIKLLLELLGLSETILKH